MIPLASLDNDTTMMYRLKRINWVFIALITALTSIGATCLYSAAGGSLTPWAQPHLLRFAIGLIGMITIALLPMRFWLHMAWPAFGIGIMLLVYVEIAGHTGMGAQRWIDLKVIKLQPSEVMKLAVILCLARYYHLTSPDHVRRLHSLATPAIIILLPVALVLLQPDLGTALMMIMGGVSIIFLAGAPLRWFAVAGGLALAAMPVVWHTLHSYQKQRILTFLNPESDPLGAGYHIMQSKIAIGSGGIHGKGFLEGSQSRLNFLPEKQTDFIFTLWVEEWGMMGGGVLLFVCGLIFAYGLWVAVQCRTNFSRYLALGLSINFSLYIFINIGMVMGILPVVGAPLPLVSYGGTAMLTCMAGFGLIMGCEIERTVKMKGL